MTQAFNLSQLANKVNSSGQADLTTAVTGTLPVGNGGTGLTAAGATGNVLTSNGTIWTSAAATNGQIQTQLFTAPGTWTCPASTTTVRVTVVGGAGGGSSAAPINANVGGGRGGVAQAIVPVSAPVTITVGAAPGTTGGTSSFGPAVSSTGGTQAPSGSTSGTAGTGTVAVGTAIRTGPAQTVSTIITSAPLAPAGSGPTWTNNTGVGAGAGGVNSPLSSVGYGGAVLVEFIG